MENASRFDESTLDDLVSRWQRQRAEGHTVTPAELCREHPTLLPEFERRVAALERMNALADASLETLPFGRGEASGNSAADRAVYPQIPGHEILGELGRGGMGVVYKARQRGLNRLVALKMILHAEHAGPEAQRRFRDEAESIARLRHPNIVQIHEIGEHNGLPYFSLDFCPGGSLARKLDGTPLLPEQAASLVQLLAQAIHVAHQAGVVHRDLKPANILFGADGAPCIGDFGLAKKLDDDQGQTSTGAVVGTPSYMAPEQALGQVRSIGPATDVYALGAILYELLTGRPPFRGATTADTILQAANEEPVPPRRLQPSVPRDVETICLKCLQKQAARRYASAQELADDLRRFQAGEPILARPVGSLERLLRWSRRSPRVAALSATVLLLLVVLATGSLLAAFHIAASRDDERKARKDAEQLAEHNHQLAESNAALARSERTAAQKAETARQIADGEAHKAREAARVLRGLFEAADPVGLNGYDFHTSRSSGERLTVRELLDRGTVRVRKEFGDQPAVQAFLLDALGNAYRSVGAYDRAGPLLQDALALRRKLDPDGSLDVAETLHNLGWWHHEKGDYEVAEKLYREALALRLRLLKTTEHLLIATTQFNLAWLLTELGESEEAEKLFHKVIDVRKRLLGDDHHDVGIALFGLSSFLVDRQRNAEAMPYMASAAKILLSQEGTGKLVEAVALFQTGVGSREAGLLALAERPLQRALALVRQALGEKHIYVALILHELAVTQERRGDLDGAEKSFRECLDIVRTQVGLTHPKAVYPISGLANLLARRGRMTDAEQLFHELLQANESRYGKDNLRVATALSAYGDFLSNRDTLRAARMYQEADRAFRKGNGQRTRFFAMNLSDWAFTCWRLGQHKQAEKAAREALPLLEHHFGRDSLTIARVLDTLALALLGQQRYGEAEESGRRALEWCQQHPSARQQRCSVLDTMGRLHRARGDLAQAERDYRAALTLARKEYSAVPAELAYYLQNLADLLAQREAYAQAAPLFEEAVAVLKKDRGKPERAIVKALCHGALARLGAEDTVGYERHCRELARRIAGSKDVESLLLAGCTLALRPQSVPDWNEIITLTQPLTALSSARTDAALVRAVILYRAGRFTEARTLLQSRQDRSDSPSVNILLALCQQQLQKNDAARQQLKDTLARSEPSTASVWTAKFFLQSLRREAEMLLAANKP